MGAYRLDFRVEAVLAGAGHTVLAHEDHQVGAEQGVGSRHHAQAVVVGESAPGRPRGGHGDIALFRHLAQGIPALALEHPLPRHDQRPLRLGQHFYHLGHFRISGVGPGVAAILALVVKILELVGVLETGPGHLGGEIQVHRPGDAGFQVAKGVAAVLVHPGGVDQALAVLADALGLGLLVTGLDEGLAIVPGDGHIAGQHQQRGARGVGRGDIHDHVGEAGALGAGGRHHLAGGP